MTPQPARQLAAQANTEDAALMARVRQQDTEALGVLYDRHAAMVHGLGRRVLGDPAEAGDLLQDVFLHLWRRAELFDGERGQFTGWLVSLTRNRALDRLRARRAREHEGGAGEAGGAATVGSAGAAAPAPEAAAPAESAYAHELRSAVTRALALLPQAQRAALELAYFDGWSHEDIARHLAVPLDTAKGRVRHGMVRLRDLLGEFADAGVMTEAEE